MLKEVLGYENIDVNAKAEDECTALHLAAQNGELKVVQVLLDDGRCDVDACAETKISRRLRVDLHAELRERAPRRRDGG